MAPFVCPHCGVRFETRAPVFPFCSERCKLLDLGAWASERYTIPVVETDTSESTLPTSDEE
jgi:hypothetical protein